MLVPLKPEQEAQADTAALPAANAPTSIPAGATQAKVVEVVDGDTITVDIDGRTETVRLIGIDTPETRDPNDPVECYGAEATKRTKVMLPKGRTVYLEKDITDRDRYDRLLRYVWFKGKDDGKPRLANEILVREGFAVVSTYQPDSRYADWFTTAQKAARDEGRGLWPTCGGADTPLSATQAPVPTEPPALVSECSTFASFSDAEAYYDAHPDAVALDPNRDGRACEVYFGVDQSAPPPPPSSGDTSGGGAPIYTGGDRNCSDFATHAEAQAAWEAAGGSAANNVWGLDRDRNGIACESLP